MILSFAQFEKIKVGCRDDMLLFVPLGVIKYLSMKGIICCLFFLIGGTIKMSLVFGKYIYVEILNQEGKKYGLKSSLSL